jgi:hypothetical protein
VYENKQTKTTFFNAPGEGVGIIQERGEKRKIRQKRPINQTTFNINWSRERRIPDDTVD